MDRGNLAFEMKNMGIDHVELITRDLNREAKRYERMGFEKIGQRVLSKRKIRSELWAQGFVRVLISEPLAGADGASDSSVGFLERQSEGFTVLGVEVHDVNKAMAELQRRGARVALPLTRYESSSGTVVRGEVFTPGNLRFSFIERTSNSVGKSEFLFDEGLVASRGESPSPMGIRVIDHLTNNIDMGETKTWVDFYTKIMGFIITRHFDIRTGRTGLISDVVQSPDGRIIVPINEATEKESQVQEFVNRMKGPGVQHLAFLCLNLVETLRGLREKAGMNFLTVPSTYYEEVPTRVPGVTESLKVLEDLGILLDGDSSGYLLQIFSEEIVGPFFFEFIQRKGNKGFGEGNFKALFEAIERDQIRRGVLKPN